MLDRAFKTEIMTMHCLTQKAESLKTLNHLLFSAKRRRQMKDNTTDESDQGSDQEGDTFVYELPGMAAVSVQPITIFFNIYYKYSNSGNPSGKNFTRTSRIISRP